MADPDEPAGDPAELAVAAVEHGDEHVIKLTEACLRQFDRWQLFARVPAGSRSSIVMR